MVLCFLQINPQQPRKPTSLSTFQLEHLVPQKVSKYGKTSEVLSTSAEVQFFQSLWWCFLIPLITLARFQMTRLPLPSGVPKRVVLCKVLVFVELACVLSAASSAICCELALIWCDIDLNKDLTFMSLAPFFSIAAFQEHMGRRCL